MLIKDHLKKFYMENDLPLDGGYSLDGYPMDFKLFTMQVPNPQFRKDVIHIHDIEHILYDCDTSWRGEGFVSGFEIATGFWKKMPIGFYSLWAMGFCLILHPSSVYKGFHKGLNNRGLLNLNLKKEQLLEMELSDLKIILSKNKEQKMGFIQMIQFSFWSVICLSIILFPIILLLILYFLLR